MTRIASRHGLQIGGAFLAASLVMAACSSDAPIVATDTASESSSTTLASDQTDPTTATTASADGSVVDDTDGGTDPVDESADPAGIAGTVGIPVEDGWEMFAETWFVWNVAADDVLNVRSGPGAEHDIVATLAPEATGISRYSEVSWNGDTAWGVVALEEGAGWVALDFVRPEVGELTEVGSGSAQLRSAAAQAQAGLSDPTSLAALVGPAGLTISLDTYIAEDDVVLTSADLADPTASYVWGYEYEEDDVAIERTIEQHLRWVQGSPALTSTQQVGFLETVGSGNTINNIDDVFPGSSVVEYYFGGTEYYGNLDWDAVRFVFETDESGEPGSLLAILNAAWTP